MNGFDDIGCDQLLGKPGTPCMKTASSVDDNTCKLFGMNMMIVRSKSHWESLVLRYDSSYFKAIPGVTFRMNKICGGCEHIDRSSLQAIDGGNFWVGGAVNTRIAVTWSGKVEKDCWLETSNPAENLRIRDHFAPCFAITKYVCSYNTPWNSDENNTNISSQHNNAAVQFFNLKFERPIQNGKLLMHGEFSVWGNHVALINMLNINLWCYAPSLPSWPVVYHRKLQQFELNQIYTESLIGSPYFIPHMANATNSSIGPRGFGKTFNFSAQIELGQSCPTGNHTIKCVSIASPKTCINAPLKTNEFSRILDENGNVELVCGSVKEDTDTLITEISSFPFHCEPSEYSKSNS
jgi:hypothetical protein